MVTGEWLIDWEYDGDEANALIHERIPEIYVDREFQKTTTIRNTRERR